MSTEGGEEGILADAKRFLAEGRVEDWATAVRMARAVNRAAEIYMEAKVRIETERRLLAD